MKKFFLFLLILLLIGGAVIAWMLIGPATGFDSEKETVYIRSKTPSRKSVMDSIEHNNIVKYPGVFNWLAEKMDYWKKIRPGKYEIKKGSSMISVLRKLRNGTQTPVNLVIAKLRTKEGLAHMAEIKFESDSLDMIRFLNSNDSLKEFDATSETALWNILPDTYTYFWNSSSRTVYKKFYEASKKFWTDERKQKATAQGLTPLQAYIIASIIEEETTNDSEKPTIASVYLNRIRKNMPLQADPTVKFALKDFTITRVYSKHTSVESPYNTYRNAGIPPGPICTPSRKSIDAVLNPAKTEYLYFVASPSMKQEHVFSVSYEEHLKKAKQYQMELDKLDTINKSTR